MLRCSSLALLLVVGLLLALVGCRSAPAAPRPPLVVASDLDNPPFAYVDSTGAPAGRDIEMMNELARRIDRELEWRRMPFARLIKAVARGEVDVVCATIGITPERAQLVGFTHPYFETRIVLVERAAQPLPEPIPTGARLSGGLDTTAERAIRTHAPQASFVAIGKDDPTALAQLEAGTLDAIAMDEPAARARVALSSGRLALHARPICGESYALVLPKDRAELLAELDAALDQLASTGWLAELDARHGLR